MAAPLIKISTPGIYKRGNRYVAVYRDANGRQHKESTRTLDEARKLKAKRTADVASGEHVEQTRVTLHAYAREWVERHHGIRDETREDYRRMLDQYALRYFDARLRLTALQPHHVAKFIAWLCDDGEQGQRLSDKTVRNVVGPLRACLTTAREEGLVRSNPCAGLRYPKRPQVEDDDDHEDDVRALGRDQLAAFLTVVHPRYRLLFRLLATTGLRVSEAIALQWRHVQLDGARPHVKVRRRIVRGRVGPPKSRHSRRDVPLPAALVDELRAWRRVTEWPGADQLVFPTTTGTSQSKDNLTNRYLKPAMQEAGAPWAGLHTFRHTFASLHIARATNVVQLSRLLGHHSPAFTLSTYAHLLDDGVGAPLDLDAALGGNTVATSVTLADVRPDQ